MRKPKRVLLLGGGGMGMAPLAHYLSGAGVQVEAHDNRFTEPVRSELLKCGVEILEEPIPRKSLIILSTLQQYQRTKIVLKN